MQQTIFFHEITCPFAVAVCTMTHHHFMPVALPCWHLSLLVDFFRMQGYVVGISQQSAFLATLALLGLAYF